MKLERLTSLGSAITISCRHGSLVDRSFFNDFERKLIMPPIPSRQFLKKKKWMLSSQLIYSTCFELEEHVRLLVMEVTPTRTSLVHRDDH